MKTPHPCIKPLVEEITSTLSAFGIRYQVCGSIRREADFHVEDKLDIVVDSFPEVLLSEAIANLNHKFSHNERVLTIMHPLLNVRFCQAFNEEWGAMMLAVTGNTFFTVQMRSFAKKQGYKLNAYGLWHNENIIAGISEEQIFDAIGARYYHPRERNFINTTKIEEV